MSFYFLTHMTSAVILFLLQATGGCYGAVYADVPSRVWPLATATCGMDIDRNPDSVASLHGCIFSPTQGPQHPYPSLVLNGNTFVDIPLTNASVSERGDELIDILSLRVYMYTTSLTEDGILFEYKDDNGIVYFQVSIESGYPTFTLLNLGVSKDKCLPGIPFVATEKLVVNGWNHMTIAIHTTHHIAIYLGEETILAYKWDCEDTLDIHLPGVLRVGTSHDCFRYITGVISCLRIFADGVLPDYIETSENACTSYHTASLSWNFTNAELQQTCKPINDNCPLITTGPSVVEQYYHLRQRDAGILNDTGVLGDVIVSGVIRCGLLCIRKSTCLSFNINPQNNLTDTFKCRLYYIQHAHLDFVQGSNYYDLINNPK